MNKLEEYKKRKIVPTRLKYEDYYKSPKRRLQCYLAHPYGKKNSTDKPKIIEILEDRGIEVLDPFLVEGDILEKYKVKEYYQKPYYKLAREIWVNDLRRVEECDMILVWLPFPSMGTAQEMAHAYRYRKFIQVISPLKHPSIAYVLKHGNQQFETIEDFEKLRIMRWD